MKRLHITNGDSAADLIKASGLDGKVLPWRDPMHHGPFGAGLTLAEQSRLRASYLSDPTGDQRQAEQAFLSRDNQLRAFAKFDEVVLWFEHDLLDQLQILQLLDWFHGNGRGQTQLSLICIHAFDGVPRFRGLGELTPVQVASLFPNRATVSDAQLTLAVAGWKAFCASDPRDLTAFLTGDLTALPFLRAALARHLEEYPARATGLTRTELQILRLVDQGVTSPGQIFLKNMDCETALYIGDERTFATIEQLCFAREPLLAKADASSFVARSVARDRQAYLAQQLTLTNVGAAVLTEARDAFSAITRDTWLGGVHIKSGPNMWTWDGARGGLTDGPTGTVSRRGS